MGKATLLAVTFAVLSSAVGAVEMAVTGPLYPNSIVSNDLSFITLDDPRVDYCLAHTGVASKEMPGGSTNVLIMDDTLVFAANYADGTTVEIWASPDFVSRDAAQAEADEIAKRLALLPTFMRDRLRHVVLHAGDGRASAEDRGQFFVVHAKNMAFRRSENDMEETLFHESVHATMDILFGEGDPDWASNQASDPGVVTAYARDRPREDLAESAIFAFAEKYHPGRLPDAVSQRVAEVMPGRLEYLMNILPDAVDYTTQVAEAKTCT